MAKDIQQSELSSASDTVGDLGPTIKIVPRGETVWTGTAAQLIAEGVVPPDFRWPEYRGRTWTDDRFEWFAAAAGPKDYGSVYQRERTLAKDCFLAARVYAAEEELRRVRASGSLEYKQQFERWLKAQNDRAFQRLLAAVGAKKLRKPRRPSSGGAKGMSAK